MGQYLPVLALGVLAFVFAILSILASAPARARLMTPAKEAPYECGIVPSREPPERFPVRFYLVAMIFIVFDIEIIFFYPVVGHLPGPRRLRLLVEMLVFAVAVFASFVYLVANGALDWGPAKRVVEATRPGRRPTAPAPPPSAGSASRAGSPRVEAEEVAA